MLIKNAFVSGSGDGAAFVFPPFALRLLVSLVPIVALGMLAQPAGSSFALTGTSAAQDRATNFSSAPFTILEAGTTPDAVRTLIDAAGNEQTQPDAQSIVVFDSTDVTVEDSGLSHRRSHVLRKILTADAARDFSSLRFDFDPASNRVDIDCVRIHRADGRYVAIDPSAARDVPAPAHMIYWGARMKVLALPRLEPGDAIEMSSTKMGFQIAYLTEVDIDLERYIPPMRGHFYDVVLFGASDPIACMHYRLTVPREKVVQYSTYNGELSSSLSTTDSTLTYSWWAADRPASVNEPNEPDASDFVPKVVLATVPDWPEKSRWFFEVNDPVFAWNDEIAEKVEELTAGCRTDEDRMAALLHWVADNIRYSGLSMGEGEGYTLHPGIMTWEERCGVCKDIAGMLVTMLRAAGYTTYPVMTMAGARVERVPADQFNHCVVAVRKEDGSYVMLDPTWAPQSLDIWSRAEGEQNYVIGSPEGEDLTAIRTFAPEESRLSVKLATRLDGAGNLTGAITMEGNGSADSRLRRVMNGIDRADWNTFAGELLASISPGVQITGARFGEILDYGRPMRYQFDFVAPGYAAVTDSSVDLALPSARFLKGGQRFARIVDVPEVKERKHPALFWSAVQTDIEETLELPGGFRFADLPPAQEVDRQPASYEASVSASPSQLRASQSLILKKRTLPADEWAALAEVADSLHSFAGARLHGER